MARRNHYKRPNARSSRRGQSSPLAWAAVGMLAGAAVVGLMWLKLGSAPPPAPIVVQPLAPPPAEKTELPPAEKTAQPDTEQPAAAPPEQPPAEQPALTPRFEYYSVLPEMEVVIPPEELEKQPTAPPQTAAKPQTTPAPPPPGGDAAAAGAQPAPPGPVTDGPIYLMQHGSFRRTDEADRLKASLGLVGISARIEKVTIDDKGTYYRVRSGPYDKGQAYALHERLKNNGVESQVIRIKN